MFVVAVAAFEWAGLAGYQPMAQYAYATVLAVLVLVVSLWSPPQWTQLILVFAACCWWIPVCIYLWRWHMTGRPLARPSWLLLQGVLVLVPAGIALGWLHAQEANGPFLLLFLMIAIWLADISAYFAGRRWGKRKLMATVSPGKTLEGALAALICALLWGGLGAEWLSLSGFSTLSFSLLLVITVAFSIVGDLFESTLKRNASRKDSGSLLPGHGGVLDRIDSLTAAAPVFAAALIMVIDQC